MPCVAKITALARRGVAAAVLSLPALDAQAQVSITAQPQAATALAGQAATFTVGATAPGALTYQWRRNGHALPGATGAAFTIAAASQGDIDNYDVVVRSGAASATSQIARLWVTLPSYPGKVEVDLARSLRLEARNQQPVQALAALPDGRYYMLGNFVSVGGRPAGKIVRCLADGALDATFSPPAFDRAPISIALQQDGKILVAGAFATVGGEPIGALVRLNADGSIDRGFAIGRGFSNQAERVLVTPGGAIYVTGRLGAYQGRGPLSGLVKLTAGGALDPFFTKPAVTTGGFDTEASGYAVSAASGLYVTGLFDRINGVPRVRIARLLPDGSLDAAFDPGAGPNGIIYALLPLGNGQVAIGGSFSAYNGAPIGRIARLNASGALDPAFATGEGFSNPVSRLTELPGNQLLAYAGGGTFRGVFVPRVVRLTAGGALDPAFSFAPGVDMLTHQIVALPQGRLLAAGSDGAFEEQHLVLLNANGSFAALPPSRGFPGVVSAFAHLPGGRILAAGDFVSVDGQPVNRIMRLNADLTLDRTFPAGLGGFGQRAMRLTTLPDGRVLVVTFFGFVRLNQDGSLDHSFATGAQYGEFVRGTPVVLPNGRIFVPTIQSSWDNRAVSAGFVVLDPNGPSIANHEFLPGPSSGAYVNAAELLPTGHLLVAGLFSTWNGLPRHGMVRLNPGGAVDTGFVPGSRLNQSLLAKMTGGSVRRDGSIITVTQNNFAAERLRADGTWDPSYRGVVPGTENNGFRLLLQPDDRVLCTGSTPSFPADFSPPAFVRLTATGDVDPTFGVLGSGMWEAAILSDTGELLTSDGSGYLHRYRAVPPPAITLPPQPARIFAGGSIQLSATASGAGTLSFQWLKDGQPLIGATNATLAIESARTNASGAYAVVVTGYGGATTSPAATVTVEARPLAGTYFGGSPATFALFLRNDGTGVFLARMGPTQIAIASGVLAGSGREVRFTGDIVTPGGVLNRIDVRGVVTPDGQFSGDMGGASLLANAAPSVGLFPTVAGYYRGGIVGASTAVHLIAAASGEVFVALRDGGVTDSFSAAMPSSTSFNGITANAGRLTVTMRGADGIFSGTYAPAGGAALAIGGGQTDTRAVAEALVNVSARSRVGGAAGALTAGFVVAGDAPKMTLVRAVGPTLAAFGLTEALPAARLQLTRDGSVFSTGLDWGAAPNAPAIAAAAARLGAFALPVASRDAALLGQVQPGAYTAVVTGQANAEGVALVEVYDATEGPIPRGVRITNLSTLSNAGSGENALLAGFSITGAVPKRLLIRGAGPALSAFGVAGALARPRLAVYSGSRVLMENAGWAAAPDRGVIAQAAADVGAFAFANDSADAALLIHLAPGTYSAQVSGAGGATGAALVEIYDAP